MIRISENELNLRTIMDSGQCFRIFIVEESYFVTVYDVVTMNKYVRVYHVKSEAHISLIVVRMNGIFGIHILIWILTMKNFMPQL